MIDTFNKSRITITFLILLEIKKYYEKFHNVKISISNIKEIIKLSNTYLSDKKEPDRSIEILDKACTRLKLDNFYNDKINSLINQKEEYLKERKFLDAKKINKDIEKYKKKSKYLTTEIIRECYEKKICNVLGFNAK